MDKAVVEGWVDIGTAVALGFLGFILIGLAWLCYKRTQDDDRDTTGWEMGMVSSIIAVLINVVYMIILLREGIIAVAVNGG